MSQHARYLCIGLTSDIHFYRRTKKDNLTADRHRAQSLIETEKHYIKTLYSVLEGNQKVRTRQSYR